MGAAPFFQRTAVLHVMSNSIRVLEPGACLISSRLTAVDVWPKQMAASARQLKTWTATYRVPKSVHAVYVTHSSSSSVKTIQSVCSSARRSVARYGEKICQRWAIKYGQSSIYSHVTQPFQTSRYLTGCFFVDATGLFSSPLHQPPPTTPVKEKSSTTTLQAAVNAGSHSQWLLLVRPQGVMEVCLFFFCLIFLMINIDLESTKTGIGIFNVGVAIPSTCPS